MFFTVKDTFSKKKKIEKENSWIKTNTLRRINFAYIIKLNVCKQQHHKT